MFAVFHRTFVTFKSSTIIYHKTNKNTIASPWINVIADRSVCIFVYKSRRLRLNCSIQGNNHSIDQFLREIPDIELVSIQLIGLKCTRWYYDERFRDIYHICLYTRLAVRGRLAVRMFILIWIPLYPFPSFWRNISPLRKVSIPTKTIIQKSRELFNIKLFVDITICTLLS